MRKLKINWMSVVSHWSQVIVASLLCSAIIGELPASEVITIAGTGKKEYSGDGGLAKQAGAGEPYGLVVGPDEALYFCDIAFHVIRRIDAVGQISTVAGSGKKGYAGDGGLATKLALAATAEKPERRHFASHIPLHSTAKARFSSAISATSECAVLI